MLEARAPARVLLEVPTGREGVARCLEALGHHVVVADPNVAPMYATRTRKVKTDRRDARALAEDLSVGGLPPRTPALRCPAPRPGPPHRPAVKL